MIAMSASYTRSLRAEMSLLLLLLAAVLETVGDALVRAGLQTAALRRAGLFAAGAVILFGYSVLVNTPKWEFGRLLGIYIVLFFVVSQVVAWVIFHEIPTTRLLIGGVLIISGGVVISWEMIARS